MTYVPGLSRGLFSITHFACHGHYAVFKNGMMSLHFTPLWVTVTLANNSMAKAFAADSTVTEEIQDEIQYHAVPAFRNKDLPQQMKHLPLELVHARLGHQHCRSLLAANEHRLWQDTTIHMSPEVGCLSCGIATARAVARNKEHHTGASRAGEYIFLDIQPPTTAVGLTPASTYPFYLIVVDAYSRYIQFYGFPDKSTKAVVAAIKQYQADNVATDTNDYRS